MAKKKNGIQRKEIAYLLVSMFIIGVLVFIMNNLKTKTFIDNLNPIFQFLFVNLGLYAVFFLIAKFIAKKGHTLSGAIGGILSFLALDIVLPEYHVTSTGLVQGGLFGASASDYFFGYIYQAIGIPSTQMLFLPFTWLQFSVYIITFAVLFLVGAFLVKDFFKSMTNA